MNFQENEIVSLHKKYHQLEARMEKIENKIDYMLKASDDKFEAFMKESDERYKNAKRESDQNREDFRQALTTHKWFAVFLTGFATLLIGVLKFI